MKKTNGIGSRLLTILMFVFLYAPIAVLIVFSFNSTKSRTVWTGFTFDWYVKLFNNEAIISAVTTTLAVSVIAAVIATVAGTFAAVGINNMKRRPRELVLQLNNIPVTNADMITGVSLCILFVALGKMLNFELGFGTLLISHITFNIPYVILSVLPKLRQLDKNLFEAAMDLGCTWMQAFTKVIIPEIKPGIVNGLLMAFTLSVDDFVISYFTAGSVETLSMRIYAMTKKRISPEINAISTILFITILLLLVIINVREIKQEMALEKRRADFKK
ncbi:MAG: ABC transporter permease [Clostridia bacterium]|nr:ABC transporter permease [Clostridia bacterium]